MELINNTYYQKLLKNFNILMQIFLELYISSFYNKQMYAHNSASLGKENF